MRSKLFAFLSFFFLSFRGSNLGPHMLEECARLLSHSPAKNTCVSPLLPTSSWFSQFPYKLLHSLSSGSSHLFSLPKHTVSHSIAAVLRWVFRPSYLLMWLGSLFVSKVMDPILSHKVPSLMDPVCKLSLWYGQKQTCFCQGGS